MSVQVLRVSGMPCNVQLWVDDSPEQFIVSIDEKPTTEQGAEAIEAALATHILGWRRLDGSPLHRTLRAITD
ncbi:hypothetical protein [Streptomyces sp. LPB2020-019-1HS]|uniref:hypothetical protein n=1 Tax=Streptomyces sp. LPB2020-019-1HS TaxID=3409689 RepID=UPI003B66E039